MDTLSPPPLKLPVTIVKKQLLDGELRNESGSGLGCCPIII
jgi:hypothetical protein